MADDAKTANLDTRRQDRRLAGQVRLHRAGCRRHHQALCPDRQPSPSIPVSRRPPPANRRSPIIDGDEGVLLYRGYPIEQLAEHGDFIETCYLLYYGELPTPAQRKNFDKNITYHTMVHEQMARFFQGFRRDAHPMAVMVAVVGAMSAFYHDSTDINDPRQREIASHRMIAKLPTIAAMAYKYHIGQPFVYPQNDLVLCREFPAHVLCRAVRRVCGEPGAGPRHGPHLHPACRP